MKELKKILIGAASFVVLLVVTDWAVGTWSEKMYYKSKYGIFHRQIYCLQESEDEIMIFGSSRAAHHYVPQILADSLGMTCYNAGSDGECIYYHYCLLSAIIERGAKPRMAIYDVLNLDAEVSKGAPATLDAALGRLAPHYGERQAIDSLFALNGWKERVKLMSKTYRYNSKLVQTIKCNYIPSPEDRGYEAFTGKMNVTLFKKDVAEQTLRPKKPVQIEARKLEYMEKFINLCKQNDITLVLCLSPYYKESPSESVYMIRDIAEKYGFPFYDFSGNEKFDNPALFFDAVHLNDDGAKEYTKVLLKFLQ